MHLLVFFFISKKILLKKVLSALSTQEVYRGTTQLAHKNKGKPKDKEKPQKPK